MQELQDIVFAFISRNWISLSIIVAFSYIVVSIVRWYGKLGFRESSILFMQGIIVILIMYFLQWSITSSGTGSSQDINLFLFQVEVSGKNFLNTFQDAWDTQGRGYSWTVLGSKMLPAFLEEFFKFLMLVFFLKNTTKYSLSLVIGLLGMNIIFSQVLMIPVLAQIIVLGGAISVLWVFFNHDRQVLSSVNKGIYMIAIIAAGFAFGENIKYLIDHERLLDAHASISGDSTQLAYLSQLSFLRSIFGNISHMLFSAIVGYFFARGFFGAFDLIDSHKTGKATTWLRFLGADKFKKIYVVRMSIVGLAIATVIHAFYNYFMSGEQIAGFGGIGGVIITLVMGIGLFQMYVLKEKRYVTDYGSITTQIQRGKELRQLRS